jgi:hypothetical protein
MKYKVHWLIDGLVEIETDNLDNAEKIVKDKIETFINNNPNFFQEMGAKAVQGQAYLPGADEK